MRGRLLVHSKIHEIGQMHQSYSSNNLEKHIMHIHSADIFHKKSPPVLNILYYSWLTVIEILVKQPFYSFESVLVFYFILRSLWISTIAFRLRLIYERLNYMYFKASQLDWAIIGTQRAQLIRQANKTLKTYCKTALQY